MGLREHRALWVSFATVLIGLLGIGYLRDAKVLVHAFDTGIYLQWAYGFFTTGSLASSLTGEENFLAHHFQPILLLLSPLVALFPRPTTLFVCAALAATGAMVLALRCCPKDDEKSLAGVVFFAAMAHPAVSERIFYGFVPEVLALPALTWMALQLIGTPRPQKPWAWCVAFLILALCKETFLLTACIVSGTMALRSGHKKVWIACAAAFLAGFVALFFWWMPNHSALSGYYGLSYYFPPGSIGGEGPAASVIAKQLLGNFFSMQSLTTLGNIAWMTALLPFLGWSHALIPGFFGILLVLVSHSGIVHHPANHYLIPALPFLGAAALENLTRLRRVAPRLASPLVALASSFFRSLIRCFMKGAPSMLSRSSRPDLASISWRKTLRKSRRSFPPATHFS